jgi:VIT1/CCC1 family predicted Fe2+/Mn2+ transporter
VLTSIIVSAIALFTVGAVLTRFTGRPPLLSGARMLVIGAAAAGITFAIGSLFHVSTS